MTHPGLLKANKLSPRFLTLTDQALYLVALVKKKNLVQHQLDRRIPIRAITQATMSPFADNFVALHVPEEFHDVVVELEFKTELLAWLQARGALGSNVQFMDK